MPLIDLDAPRPDPSSRARGGDGRLLVLAVLAFALLGVPGESSPRPGGTVAPVPANGPWQLCEQSGSEITFAQAVTVDSETGEILQTFGCPG
ncbi:hypothetical protein BJY16_005157 [Actinoplanes octamycinicus]|uniref:Uncharacterized protein n=1 Tax=Actinoplanes octamycinicus TaxID=135948 RepID=A0A7W7H0I7_9ACTN|nr:hypothetical protein [Actinoplanes octamycinicus]MBB4741698.1 hypothetical protein [Actinoplanes octamycinicus]GIE57251.1 hypothetical protein Aoc01nite_26530 [Actinoplanes octamycinicus]